MKAFKWKLCKCANTRLILLKRTNCKSHFVLLDYNYLKEGPELIIFWISQFFMYSKMYILKEFQMLCHIINSLIKLNPPPQNRTEALPTIYLPLHHLLEEMVSLSSAIQTVAGEWRGWLQFSSSLFLTHFPSTQLRIKCQCCSFSPFALS